MKKIFFFIILGYILISAVILIVFDRDTHTPINLYVLEKDYARVLTKEETIDIPILVSTRTSFLTDASLISDASLTSDIDEVDVNIRTFREVEEKVEYQSNEYYQYFIELSFSDIYNKGLRLQLENCWLTITYVNDEDISIKLGNMYLLFHDFVQPSYIDFERLYSIHNEGLLTGIYLSLINKTEEPIQIESIGPLLNSLKIDLEEAVEVSGNSERILDLNDYIADYEHVVSSFNDDEAYYLYQNVSLLCPVQHLNQFKYINRFPIVINYRYLNESYAFVIDDFLFYENGFEFEEGMNSIGTYQY